MKNVMLDLETLGTAPGSAVLSIGAVEFNETETGREFCVNIDLHSAMSYGMRVEARTIDWWWTQSDEARMSVMKDREQLPDALRMFATWLQDDSLIWGDGATFDNVLLGSCYRVIKCKQPWRYANDRCFRTLKNLFPVERVPSEVLHSSLHDARSQAVQAIRIAQKYGVKFQ